MGVKQHTFVSVGPSDGCPLESVCALFDQAAQCNVLHSQSLEALQKATAPVRPATDRPEAAAAGRRMDRWLTGGMSEGYIFITRI